MSEPLHGFTLNNETGVINSGKQWLSLENLGVGDAVIESRDKAGTVTLTFIIPTGRSYHLPERKDNESWGAFNINATGTIVQCVFDIKN